MGFAEELNQVLPADLPCRETVVTKAAQHLTLIEEANRYFNLTRITGPREAAIKHVVDSVIPWHRFAGALHVLDAGTGAGFPGIPMALVLPSVRFTLSESIQKKARFVESAVASLGLPNVVVTSRRAEEVVRDQAVDIITARAVAPLSRMLTLFAAALKSGTKLLLYKGPDVEQEIAKAADEVRKRRVRVSVFMCYELPDNQGARTVVEIERLG